jgi:hypothetical protein
MTKIIRVHTWVVASLLSVTSIGSAAPDSKSTLETAPDAGGLKVNVAGLDLKAPWGWKRLEAESRMRRAQFEVPPPEKGGVSAEAVIFFFGKDQGGDVPTNLDRWRRSMRSTTGETMVGEVAEREVEGVRITEIQLYGTYTGQPSMAGIPPRPQENFGLVGAIVEAPGGNLFLRLLGPEATVKARLEEFRNFTASFGKEAPAKSSEKSPASEPASPPKKKKR